MPNYAKIDHFSGAQDKSLSDDDNDDYDEQEKQVVASAAKKGPSVNEQLRRVREEVAKEYDEKYKASLEDIDQYKQQLERMIKDQEQRQNAIVSRSLGDKDKLIQQLNAQKTELQNEITQTQAVVHEKEEIIVAQTQTIEQLRADCARMAKRQQE